MNVDFSNRIGAYRIDAHTGKWSIVGASDEMNAAFNQKLSSNRFNAADLNLSDATKLDIDSFQINSGNYNDICKPVGAMPKYCYGTSYGNIQMDKINKRLKDYYLGNNESIDEIKDFFKDCCRDMRVVLAQERKTTGAEPEANTQIILDTYEQFRMSNAVMAKYACDAEGSEIAYEHGWKADGSDQDLDWVYYNADYYYKSEEMRGYFKEAAKELANEWGIETVDTEARDEDVYLSYSNSFNQAWQNGSENGARISSMSDIEMMPPKGFSFFFREYRENDELCGIVLAKNGEDTKQAKVVFDKYNDGKQQRFPQKYKLGDLIRWSGADRVNDYLSNIDVFTRRYGTVRLRT